MTAQKAEYFQMPVSVAEHTQRGQFIQVWDGKRQVEIFIRAEGNPWQETIVLLHGVPASSFLYRKVIPLLAKRNKRVIAFDFPSMGLSDKAPDGSYSWSDLADITKSVFDVMSLPPSHIVVHDIAGPIGAEFAIKNPEKVASITICNTMLNVKDFEPPFPMNLFTIPYVDSITFKLMTTPMLNFMTTIIFRIFGSNAITQKDIYAYQYLLSTKKGEKAFLKTMKSFQTSQEHNKFILDGLQRIDKPTQLVWVDDDVIPDSQGQKEYIEQNFMIQQSAILESKHFPQEDQPTQLADFINDFVDTLPATEGLPQKPKEDPTAHQHGSQGNGYGDYRGSDGYGGQYSHGHSHGGHGHSHGGHGHAHGDVHM